MSKRTRISSKIDAQRISALVSRPGIDPRLWCSLCIVDAVTVEAADSAGGQAGGVFADVHIMSTATIADDGSVVAQKETVRVSPAFAGPGVGLYFPPQVGDEVVVAWADGDPDHGGMLIGRAWSASDPPPQLAVSNPSDVLLMLAKDQNLRIVAQGKGNIVLQIDQGQVLLGNEQGGNPVAREKDTVNGGWLVFSPNVPPAGAASLVYLPPDTQPTPTALLYPPPLVLLPLSGIINSGSQHVSST